MVGSFYFVLHSWLAGIAGRNKLLINMKAHLCRCAFCFAFIWFRVQGWGGGFAAFFYWGDARKWHLSHQSLVAYDTRKGIISHAWYEILWLSPHLFWLGFFSHRAFSSAQDDDTQGRMGSHLGDTLHVLELAVLYYDTSSPLLWKPLESEKWRKSTPFIILYWKLMRTMWLSESKSKVWLLSNSLPALSISSNSSFFSFLYWIGCNNLLQDL